MTTPTDQLSIDTLTEPALQRLCSICQGSGRALSRNQPCGACGGSGWLPPYDFETADVPF